MLVAARAVLLPLDALRVHATILRGEVVAVFAVVAGENDFVSAHLRFRFSKSLRPGWTRGPLPYQGSALPTELREQPPTDRAGDGARTRDIELGRLALY